MAKLLKKNCEGYGYTYVDLNSLLQFLESEGIKVTQEVSVMNGNDYILSHYEQGDTKWSMLGARIIVATGTKNDIQAYMSALTYARRYSIMANLGFGSTDDDGAAANVVPVSEIPIADIIKSITETVKGNASKKSMFEILKQQYGVSDKKLKEMEEDTIRDIYTKLCK